jgi:hypothetical protein
MAEKGRRERERGKYEEKKKERKNENIYLLMVECH